MPNIFHIKSFVSIFQSMKVVMLEDLAANFKIKTQVREQP